MKKRIFLRTLVTSLVALPFAALAKDKDKDKDKDKKDKDKDKDHDHDRDKDRDRDYDREKSRWKEIRDDVQELREEYARLAAKASQGGVSRRTREDVDYLGSEVRRIGFQFERGGFDYRELHDRIGRTGAGIERARHQISEEWKYGQRRDR